MRPSDATRREISGLHLGPVVKQGSRIRRAMAIEVAGQAGLKVVVNRVPMALAAPTVVLVLRRELRRR